MEGTSQDDFKWFGEGFDGFPKKLPEDVVEYIVFIIDAKLSDVQTRERLQAFQRALTSLEKKFLKEYIWQRDSLQLELIREDGRWMLKGSTNYGDSVADEWLIVYFLRELSREFKDAWIRIYDTDGEFLLIEAANALPKWVNPEVAEHRVWINDHRLLLIPMSQKEAPKPLQLKQALSILADSPLKAEYLPKVEEEAFHRLKQYPAAISENQHHATLPLPRKVAHILQSNPAYIAPAVEAFYLRDPISLRLLQPEKSQRLLHFPPEDFVEVSVRFTKVLYAQLLGQQWVAPEPWGSALEELVEKDEKSSSSRDKPEIGIKVAAGLEMLVQHKIYASKKASREIKLLLDDLESGEDTLPTDAEIAAWPKREDDEGWLNIDFSEFEKELAGKGEAKADPKGFGDKNAQENLRKMVERFTAFVEDEDAGLEGARGLGLDPMDVDDDSDGDRHWEDPEASDDDDEESDEESDEEWADEEFANYEKALEEFMTLSSAEKSALTDDARDLANAEEAEAEEDEEIKKLSDAMEQELFKHGALKLNSDASRGKGFKLTGDGKGKGKARAEDIPEFSGDDDDDDDDLLDDNYNLSMKENSNLADLHLAENMLKSFKGQVGMPGPVGNFMGMMGIQFPPDADDEDAPKRDTADTS